MSHVSTSDFHDKLAPMLVKELRQGLRARTFVVVFLVLQALLALILLTTASAADTDQAGQMISGIIFLCFSLAVLVVQPLRGIGAISSEVKSNTLDLMVMTRLTAWRIVLGKWSALVGQSALLFTAIIPYLILRYFFGGMNLFGELMLFALVFLGSMLLTALTVSLSANSSVLIRSLLPLIASPFLIFGIFGFTLSREIRQIVAFCTLTQAGAKSALAACLITGFAVGYTMLNQAASLIAPSVENHSTIRRLLSFVFLGAVALCGYFGEFSMGAMCSLAIIHAIPAVACSLTEGDVLLPPVIQRFARHGLAGRLCGRLFYPGWAAGSFYVLVFLGAEALMLWNHARLHVSGYLDYNNIAITISLIGSFIFPAVLLFFFRRKSANRFQTYLFLLAGSALLTLIIELITESTRSKILPWSIVWSPSSLLIFSTYPVRLSDDELLLTALIVNGAYLAILLLAALIAFRKLTGMEKPIIAEPSTAAPASCP